MAESGFKSTSGLLSSWECHGDSEKSKQAWLDTLAPGSSAWIFAYGSLLWDPGFDYEEMRPATIFGYHRRFCIFSYIYRGTPERPGLVFGLDRGGSCRGRIFRISPETSRDVLGMIWDREMVYRVYLPRTLLAHTDSGRTLCRTFVANPQHEQFAGRLDVHGAAEIIAGAVGQAGPNTDYLSNTLRHLEELGLRDSGLRSLAAQVRALADSGSN